jgi:hypothetical protein
VAALYEYQLASEIFCREIASASNAAYRSELVHCGPRFLHAGTMGIFTCIKVLT